MPGQLKYWRDTILCGYSQLFFANQAWFGGLLLLSSFFNPAVGFGGLLSVLVTQLTAHATGFNRHYIRTGVYSFNSLLVGLCLSSFFQMNAGLVIVLIVASLLTFLFTVWLSSVFSKFGMPFLSLPSIIGIWIILLNVRSFSIGFILPHTAETATGSFTCIMEWSRAAEAYIPGILKIYLRSVSYILFQPDIFSGLIMTVALLVHSRISFSLSFIGFLAGYFFFGLMYPNLPPEDYTFSSMNYIFTAMALGGFFFIPSIGSYVLVLVSVPLTWFIITAMAKIAEIFYLPLFSLPFSVVTMLLMIALNNRYVHKYIHAVVYQLFSPEKNLYATHTYMERFRSNTYIHIQLPFFGEWFVSQGHDGKITHKEDWQYAWDFVVTDEEKHTFRLPGEKLNDFYCYGLPVLSPGDGYVVTVIDDIDDNDIGDVDLANNWGNTVVIKHAEFLYSKISHIKKGSFKVKAGDWVKRGEVIALCGNSGRSPEPHIHFQQQAMPSVGAKTLKYPISYYITKENGKPVLKSFDYPQEGESIYKPAPTDLMAEAFYLIPGKTLEFKVSDAGAAYEKWEVFVDAYNYSYLYCHRTKSVAYFTNNGTLFYFTSFTGDKNSLLYSFYLGAYKTILSCIPGIEIKDSLPVDAVAKGLVKWSQDFLAPFHIFINPEYTAVFSEVDNVHHPSRVTLKSWIGYGKNKNSPGFEIEISENKIKKIKVLKNNTWIVAENIG